MHDINNSLATIHRLRNLLDSAEFSDVQLIVGNNSFHAHKLILGMASDVLKAMLTNPLWPEFYQSRVVLVEDVTCVQVFGDFLKYLYTGIVHLEQESVLPLLKLADKYVVIDLSSACVQFMLQSCENGTGTDCIINWYQYAKLSGCDSLLNACQCFITNNFDAVVATDDFTDMQFDVLVEFLSSSDLVVSNEMAVYAAAKRWLMTQELRRNSKVFQAYFSDVISNVRFPMMNLSGLRRLHDNDDFLRRMSAQCDAIKHLFQEAEIYNKLPKHNRRLSLSNTVAERKKFQPRNYTNEKWNSFLIIEDFRDFSPYSVRPMFFLSPISGSDADNAENWEWNVELYPKGVYFDRLIMIGLQESLTLPACFLSTVRLSVKSNCAAPKHAQISVLSISRTSENVEFVKTMKSKTCVFDSENKQYNIDDIILYDSLNDESTGEQYLTGNGRNTLKIAIIIKPVCESVSKFMRSSVQ